MKIQKKKFFFGGGGGGWWGGGPGRGQCGCERRGGVSVDVNEELKFL